MMGWIELLSDWRMQFLIVSIILAAIVATVLTFFESKVIHIRKRSLIRKQEANYVDYVRETVSSGKSVKEKLDLLDMIAKKFFSESFGTSINGDYSVLVEKLKKNQINELGDFCNLMFKYFYSRGEVTDADVQKTLELFIKGFKTYQRVLEDTREKDLYEKVDGMLKNKELRGPKDFGSRLNLHVEESREKVVAKEKTEDKMNNILGPKEVVKDFSGESNVKASQEEKLVEEPKKKSGGLFSFLRKDKGKEESSKEKAAVVRPQKKLLGELKSEKSEELKKKKLEEEKKKIEEIEERRKQKEDLKAQKEDLKVQKNLEKELEKTSEAIELPEKKKGFFARLFSRGKKNGEDYSSQRAEWLEEMKSKDSLRLPTTTGSKEWLDNLRREIRAQ